MRNPVQRTTRVGLAAVLAFSGTWMAAAFAEKLEPLKIGAAFPAFTLKDSAGTEHTLAQYKDKIVVVNFCTQECPFSLGVEPSINALATTYKDKDVVFLGVDSNKDLEAAAVQKHVQEAGLAYPVLKDVDNKLADAVGARVTPEIFVIGKDGQLAYHGAPDDRSGPTSTPTEFYLQDALEALTTGKSVAKPTVKPWGCGIKRIH